MGRREEISEELDQLAGEIEKDILRRRVERRASAVDSRNAYPS
ncbi:hypothetical protein VOI32_36525 [Paraburkholderia caribensis]|uniref:Uncharacterized protein n=1 Tax=Paraburkholderia caribensis TaxID=75105 RepID=A0ABV0EB30_9BURK|nr:MULTISPECIES: hypothetical protein [Paraburkholderia]